MPSNPSSDAEMLCLNQLLEGDRTDEPCRSVVEGKACELGSGQHRVQDSRKSKKRNLPRSLQ